MPLAVVQGWLCFTLDVGCLGRVRSQVRFHQEVCDGRSDKHLVVLQSQQEGVIAVHSAACAMYVAIYCRRRRRRRRRRCC